jgi:hypothetical protein
VTAAAAAFFWAGGIGDDSNIWFGDDEMVAAFGGAESLVWDMRPPICLKSNPFLYYVSFWGNDWIYRK